jgi:hypothetical protein
VVFFSYLAACRCGSDRFSVKLQIPEAAEAKVLKVVVFSTYF